MSIKKDIDAGVLRNDLDVPHAARALIALLDGLQSQQLLNPQLDLIETYDFAARTLLGMELQREGGTKRLSEAR